MKRLFTFFLIMSATDIFPGDRPMGKPFATRSEIVAQHGIAATSQPLATQVALDILKAGGNAIVWNKRLAAFRQYLPHAADVIKKALKTPLP